MPMSVSLLVQVEASRFLSLYSMTTKTGGPRQEERGVFSFLIRSFDKKKLWCRADSESQLLDPLFFPFAMSRFWIEEVEGCHDENSKNAKPSIEGVESRANRFKILILIIVQEDTQNSATLFMTS